jgi:hypothetical protein
MKISYLAIATGVTVTAAGFISFEYSRDLDLHDQLHGVLTFILGLAVTMTGVLGAGMCHIAHSAVTSKLAADILAEHVGNQRASLRLLPGDPPRHHHG